MITKLLLALVCIGAPLAGQLRLIVGSPVPTASLDVAAALFEVGEDGKLHSLADLVSPRDGINWGMGWIAFSPETALAVILADDLSVADLDAATPPPMPPMRAFGHFIAIAEVQPKDAQNRESAGRSEWRKGATKMGPDLEYMLREYKDAYPGKLHLYDAETERVYSISTNQGDSEVLLVENGTVYYRASDRLYSVPITDIGLGHPPPRT